MNLTQTLRRVKRSQWRGLERLVRRAFEEGYAAGQARAHGSGRRGRTIRADATVAGLVNRIERHFGLDRYGFEVRVVHGASGRRVPAGDRLGRYRREEE
ncbi:MAG TPA: hypothetical protein VMJ70_07965 [Candidatus Sulfotelmatobacter sp.]|nr:hypothetical protein [Candidatus Sulfotelmatobacter sp.]